jgi:lipopolysaccharide transport system permease protein
MLRQLSTIWRFKSFWLSLVVMDLRTRYRRSILGVGWSLMNPLMMTVVFCLVFGAWFQNPDWRSYGPYFLAGMTLFEFVRASALGGCTTFFRNESYIRQYPLPLAIYVLRTVLGALIHFMIALGVVILALIVLQPNHWLRPLEMIPVVLPSIVLLFLFCWSVSTLSSFMTVYFQDTQQLLEVIFQVFFFLTPIMYPEAMLIDRGLNFLLQINPVVTFLELIRAPLLKGEIPSLWCFEKAIMIIALFGSLAIAAIAWFEKKLIFHL